MNPDTSSRVAGNLDVPALDALRLAWCDEYDEIWVHGGEWCAHHKGGHDGNVLTGSTPTS